MRYTITWTCKACGHRSWYEQRVPKYNPPRQPDWKALERRARCSKCLQRGQADITVRGG